MRIVVLGVDGFLGWPFTLHLHSAGHTLAGVDSGARRRWVSEHAASMIPIPGMHQRSRLLEMGFDESRNQSLAGYPFLYRARVQDEDFLRSLFTKFRPDAVVHLAHMPSAPYSMRSLSHASYTFNNNVGGTLTVLWAMREACPEAHLLTIGSMGELGTPDCDIPEAPPSEFPRCPGSYYHSSKCANSINIEFACRTWGLRATDVMQGVVYGTRIDAMAGDPELATRLDADEAFGTVISRFCAQAVADLPLTVYGEGGQTRGFLPLRDSIQCLTLALTHPPTAGDYRVFNQFEETYSVNHLAKIVREVYHSLTGHAAEIAHVDNPRVEKEQHHYRPDHQKLFDLGYVPTNDLRGQVAEIIEDLLPHRERILEYRAAIEPKTRWR